MADVVMKHKNNCRWGVYKLHAELCPCNTIRVRKRSKSVKIHKNKKVYKRKNKCSILEEV